MISRRTFLTACGVASVQAFPLPFPLGFQSFDLHAAYREDFSGALLRVAGVGYQWIDYVWLGGSSNASPVVAAMNGRDVRQAFDAAGLACPNCHFSWQALHEDYDGTIAIAHDLGLQSLVCQADAAHAKTLDGWRWHADHLNELGRKTKRDGILTGYNNHPTEFTELEGKLPFELWPAVATPAS